MYSLGEYIELQIQYTLSITRLMLQNWPGVAQKRGIKKAEERAVRQSVTTS